MKKKDIEGLLLCSKCENQLRVDVYSEEFGFFKVYPCVHCVDNTSLEPEIIRND